MSERPHASIVPVRFGERDLETIEAAQHVMGDGTTSQFVRTAAVMLAKAILEASASVDGRPPANGWNSCELKGELTRKPEVP
jgi:hypothetical protein